jgi:hypothetical protein
MGDWIIGLLLIPYECERLRKLGFPGSSVARLHEILAGMELSPAEMYALLSAVGCPRLGFLLTNLDPRDPVEEAISSWRRWLTYPFKYEKGGETRVMVVHHGFLVSAGYLEPLDEETIEKWGEGASAELDARVIVDRELERLIELVEAGFEGSGMEGFFDRYIDGVAEIEGWYEDTLVAGEDWTEEELREWLALGVGEPGWAPDGSLKALGVKVKRASELPAEVRERLWRRWKPSLLGALKNIARLLAILRFTRINAFLFYTG